MKEIIDKKLGMINIFEERELDLIEKKDTTLVGQTCKPGEKTTLNNFFDGEVTYLGEFKGHLQFLIGIGEMNKEKYWVNSFKRIDENRIVTVYKAGSARDYIFKGGKWK